MTNRGATGRRTETKGYETLFYAGGDPGSGQPTAFTEGDLLNGVTVGGTYTTGNADNNAILTFSPTANKFRRFHFGDVDPGSLAVDANKSKNITFLGVPGTLTCGDTACTVASAPDGTFSFTNSPTFAPATRNFSNISVRIVSEIGNTKYVTFGYWLNTTGTGTNLKHSIDTFARADGYGDPYDSSVNAQIDDFSGSATYSGGAGGVYVLKTGNLLDNPDLHHGEFVADVALKAQYGRGNANLRPSDEWKITGNINDFRSSTNDTHDQHLSAWDLALSADFGSRGADNAVNPENGVVLEDYETQGGGGTGSWIGAFYGTKATLAEPKDIEAIVGEFNGHFVNGHVVGAFAATVDD